MRKTNKKKTSGRNGVIKKFFITKTWDTRYRGQTLNQEEVIYRIENNLPLDDLYNILNNRYKHKPKPKKEITSKVCRNCKEELPIDNYYRVNGYHIARCKKCHRENGI